jgi:hypothetical protein
MKKNLLEVAPTQADNTKDPYSFYNKPQQLTYPQQMYRCYQNVDGIVHSVPCYFHKESIVENGMLIFKFHSNPFINV